MDTQSGMLEVVCYMLYAIGGVMGVPGEREVKSAWRGVQKQAKPKWSLRPLKKIVKLIFGSYVWEKYYSFKRYNQTIQWLNFFLKTNYFLTV